MRPYQYEQAVLSAILGMRVGWDMLRAAAAELLPDRFGYDADGKPGISHRLIYATAVRLVADGRAPDTLSVAAELGERLADVGGDAYLRMLVNEVPGELAIQSWDGFPDWVCMVDDMGRLRQAGELLGKHANRLRDVEALLGSVEDVDEYLMSIQSALADVMRGGGSRGRHVSELVEEWARYLEASEEGAVDVVPTGWPSVNRARIMPKAGLTVLGGHRSMGKTAWSLGIALGTALRLKSEGLPGVVVINSLDTPGWRLVARMSSMLSGVNLERVMLGEAEEWEREALLEKAGEIAGLPMYVDDEEGLTSAGLARRALALHAPPDSPLVLLVVDFAGLIRERDDSEEQARRRILRNIRRVARVTGACVLLIWEYSKTSWNSKTRIGTDVDFAWSNMVSYSAEVILHMLNWPQMRAVCDSLGMDLQVPGNFNPAFAYVAATKIKGGEAPKYIPFYWEPEYVRFRDLALVRNINISGDTFTAGDRDF